MDPIRNQRGRLRRPANTLAAVAVLAMLGAACSGGRLDASPATTDPDDGPVTSEATATTEQPGSTPTTAPSTTASTTLSTTAPTPTTAPPTTAPAPAPTTSPPTTASGSPPAPDGSGCTPGSGGLGDGRWFGYAAAVSADELRFDLACWFSGSAAVAAAAEDGSESPPPNDYYVRNADPTARVLHPSAATPVTWYPSLGDPTSETSTDYDHWRSERGDIRPGLWITIQGGRVVAIAEQWTA